MFPGVNQRTAHLDGQRDHVLEVNPFHLEVDLAVGHARDVEQVVNQPGQLLDLTLDHLGHLPNRGIRPALQAEDLHGIANWGQRVAQLVSQHRQELILAAASFLKITEQRSTIRAKATALRVRLTRGRRSLLLVTDWI